MDNVPGVQVIRRFCTYAVFERNCYGPRRFKLGVLLSNDEDKRAISAEKKQIKFLTAERQRWKCLIRVFRNASVRVMGAAGRITRSIFFYALPGFKFLSYSLSHTTYHAHITLLPELHQLASQAIPLTASPTADLFNSASLEKPRSTYIIFTARTRHSFLLMECHVQKKLFSFADFFFLQVIKIKSDPGTGCTEVPFRKIANIYARYEKKLPFSRNISMPRFSPGQRVWLQSHKRL